jgi:transposase
MRKYASQWPHRLWAIEGCKGIGRHIANRLLADGEQVVDVPPKLSAKARVFATGQGRKTDATDAHSIALVGTRMAGLRPVVNDEQLALLRILVDRRRSLGADHTRMVSQLHQLLLELIPGGAKKSLSAAQAKTLLATVRPRDAAGKARRRVAAELIGDLERVYRRSKEAGKELKELVAPTGTTVMDLHGIGPSGAARLLVVSDITRFPSRAHFASWKGTAPIDASSGEQVRHRALPRREPADQPGAAHHGHRPAAQPHRWTRLLRPEESCRQDIDGSDARAERRLSDIVYRCMISDAVATATGTGGHRGTTTGSSVTDSHHPAGSSERHFPDPPRPRRELSSRRCLDTEGSQIRAPA